MSASALPPRERERGDPTTYARGGGVRPNFRSQNMNTLIYDDIRAPNRNVLGSEYTRRRALRILAVAPGSGCCLMAQDVSTSAPGLGCGAGCQTFGGMKDELIQLTCAAELALHHCIHTAVTGRLEPSAQKHLDECLVMLQARGGEKRPLNGRGGGCTKMLPLIGRNHESFSQLVLLLL